MMMAGIMTVTAAAAAAGAQSSVNYVFEDAAQFSAVHKTATENEFARELSLVRAFNVDGPAYAGHVLMKVTGDGKQEHWIVLIDPGRVPDPRLPREGEKFRLGICNEGGKMLFARHWETERIANPCAILERRDWARYIALRVTIPAGDAEPHFPRPLIDLDHSTGPSAADITLDDDSGKTFFRFSLTVSKATMKSEIGALSRLCDDRLPGPGYQKRYEAFDYLLSFKNPASRVNLFETFPHMLDPGHHGVPEKLVLRIKSFDRHQDDAYRNLLAGMPCGVAILPGGPGAGKTHWNLTVAATAQAREVIITTPRGGEVCRSAKVVYIIDINKALDDVANKMVKLYEDLGMNKQVVRMYGWHRELEDSDRVKGSGKNTTSAARPDFSRQFLLIAKMADLTPRGRRDTGCVAPNLDEAAWIRFEKQRETVYQDLDNELQAIRDEPGGAITERFKNYVYALYADVLGDADFIATTPVAASQYFYGMFEPDLVFFDEAPHARELANLIAIAAFSPVAWIFSGDHRQTRPHVGSKGGDNPLAAQLQTSMMLRAEKAGAVSHSLLINHRARANLQQLASDLFYDGAMISGVSAEETVPATTVHLQAFLAKYKRDPPRHNPFSSRVLVHLRTRGQPVKVGTSFWNPDSTSFIMARCRELLRDPHFLRLDGKTAGTILVIAPYREAFLRFQSEIEKLPGQLWERWGDDFCAAGRVEARTVDTVQGHEADFVFLDLVRDVATRFLDDPNRLCVALTRARQAEMIVMHADMPRSRNYHGSVYLKQIRERLSRAGEVFM